MYNDFEVGSKVVSKYDPEGTKGTIVSIFWEQSNEEVPPTIYVKWDDTSDIEVCDAYDLIVA